MGQACSVADSRIQQPGVYRPRRPQQTDLYRIIQDHLEPFLAAKQAEDPDHVLPAHVERTLREYLNCGILAHGFARARCSSCGFEYLIAFSCKTRGLCPSCGAKYMCATAAHLVDNVLPRVPYRQLVLSLPKRIRSYVSYNRRHATAVLRIFLRTVEETIHQTTPEAPNQARIAAVSFIQRFGSSLNQHLHFHSIVSDGLFGPADDEEGSEFCQTAELTCELLGRLTESLRRKILRYLVKHGLLDDSAAQDMLTWKNHGGFSVDASVCIPDWDRLGLEGLIRYCARPPFAESRLTYFEPDRVVYHLKGGNTDGQSHLILSPIEFIQRLALLIPPPRVHRNIYYGAIAPNCRLRPAVVKQAAPAAIRQLTLKQTKEKMGLNQPDQRQIGQTAQPQKQETKRKRKASRNWAMLLARIYEALPLICKNCNQPMKIIAFVTEPKTIATILNAISEETDPPPLAQPRAPPEETDFTYADTEPEYDYNQAPAGW